MKVKVETMQVEKMRDAFIKLTETINTSKAYGLIEVKVFESERGVFEVEFDYPIRNSLVNYTLKKHFVKTLKKIDKDVKVSNLK